ncbi:hypothetical protein PGT21_009669 [Puccinia graminis f. sp. tritici]|uniref:PQ-loop repeat-containing protein 1 n=2 Tax=Puccinia graminis f. sp. tritici TaxID=56615 RepID=E3LBE0_PUCGT|nr:uncharacterized protein PGTG_19762 [Puccinia graminis f. sp. tritici CRL 75-36-700-3]EFP93865.2 hypothetical protein PGTG_19762 [Puccinia graminis f. sp. tritici CRL 75-36-700-3]KAA1118892.1 hypothetical protein PGT21_009669 [Puccinia graminis f. sp. tritici]
MAWMSTLASIGIALGSPLVYLDQYLSIQKTQSSQGFSHLICVVLLIANITRLFYWLGERFDTALLVQSILMIIAQLGLLRICLKYTPTNPTSRPLEDQESCIPDGSLRYDDHPEQVFQSSGTEPLRSRSPPTIINNNNHNHQTVDLSTQQPPFSINRSSPHSFDHYIDFFALLFAVEAALFILFQRYDWFIQAIGFFSLGLESTLPIPQLITNFRRKSLAGLSSMVLFGWLFGDSFKSIYLVFVTPDSNSIQFKICALFQLSIDILILTQALIYRRQTKLDSIELEGSPDHPAPSSMGMPPDLVDHPDQSAHDPRSRLMIVDDSAHVV